LPAFIRKIASKVGVEPALFEAICRAESNLDPYAVRFEPAWRYHHFPREWASRLNISVETERVLQACSWGLPQVMGSVAREYGFQDSLVRLTEPELCLYYGAKHLKKFMEKYGDDAEAVSAYNQGSNRKTEGGMFLNQTYVDRVFRIYRLIRPDRIEH